MRGNGMEISRDRAGTRTAESKIVGRAGMETAKSKTGGQHDLERDKGVYEQGRDE